MSSNPTKPAESETCGESEVRLLGLKIPADILRISKLLNAGAGVYLSAQSHTSYRRIPREINRLCKRDMVRSQRGITICGDPRQTSRK